jgi:TolA-binding protein
MALAELQVRGGQYDEAIETYRDVAARKDGDLPVDAVLIQLARVYQLAGKRAEALQTYQRVMSEFPESTYQADARRAAESLKTEGRP